MAEKYIPAETVLRYIAGSELAAGITGDRKTERFCQTMYKHVDKIPAAKVLPAAKGTWITERERPSNPRQFGSIRATCSRCGAFALNEMVNVGSFVEKQSDFCPSCGADMRQEVKDG